MNYFDQKNDTICALSTASGLGAIAVIRISGAEAFEITNRVFTKNIAEVPSHTTHFGRIKTHDGVIIDEVLLTVLKEGKSFTGENTVEIACHGSTYIQQEILQLLISSGCRMAQPGEFTMRAFLNGKMDLSQAEAVADLIASESKKSHEIAMNQMRGGFSSELNDLREKLIHFASLVELELDFAEEDVEFADRTELKALVSEVLAYIQRLMSSFELGNAIKNGVPVAIVGAPNTGKSTLLNIIGLLDVHDKGEYLLDGTPIKNMNETKAAMLRNKFLGFVFQSFNLINYKTALDNVALPLYYQGMARKERMERSMHYLEKVGFKP